MAEHPAYVVAITAGARRGGRGLAAQQEGMHRTYLDRCHLASRQVCVNGGGEAASLPKTAGSEEGAGDGTRTRDNLLGRQALYQLSYSRVGSRSGRGERTRTSDLSVPNAARYRLRHTPPRGWPHGV